MALVILRCSFLVVAGGIAAIILGSGVIVQPWTAVAVFIGILLLAGGVVLVDMLVQHKRIDMITAVYFGVVVGLSLTYVISLALAPLLEDALYRNAVMLVVGMVLCYTCISTLMQTKDDFRFIIPYVEFAKETKGPKPLILDTSVVIDGRIADLAETGVFDSRLIMPRFVLVELQAIADSNDRLRRARGRRGLDVLNRLRKIENVDFAMDERELPEMSGHPVDMKLVLLAKHMRGKLVTGDYNLNKVARLHNVPVINLNEVSNSLKPVFLPGENVSVRIVKPGEGAEQGVGYLDDGTMIVVEGGRQHLNETVRIAVTSVLQTSAGRMVFGRFDGVAESLRE